jgi:hypothetical protein
MRNWVARRIYKTMNAIMVTKNYWRARKTLHMDDGSSGWHVTLGRIFGLIEHNPKGTRLHIPGYPDIVRLTAVGVEVLHLIKNEK